MKVDDPDEIFIKLVDFSLALDSREKQPVKYRVGSQYYLAPEILAKDEYHKKSDVWAATIMVYAILLGKMPFKGKNFKEIEISIKEMDYRQEFSDKKWSHLSQESKSFIRNGLRRERKVRLESDAMLVHKWIENVRFPLQKEAKSKNL